MIHYIKFQVTETRIVELKRVPTNEEIKLINHNTAVTIGEVKALHYR